MAEAQPAKASGVLFEGCSPVLPVKDIAASIEYYENILGFKLNWGGGGFASVSRGKVGLFLCADEQGTPGTWVWIGVADAGAVYEEYKAAGAKIRNTPQNYAWAYEFQVEDLDGNVLRLGSDVKEPAFGGEWLRDDGSRWRQLGWDKWEKVK